MKRCIALALTTAALATAPADARPCVTAGRVITAREHVTCAKAKRVARSYFQSFEAPAGWTCEHGRRGVWRGYCETRRAYFSWKPV